MLRAGVFVFVCVLCCGLGVAQDVRPVSVYILAGQSNMQGKGAVANLEYLLRDPSEAGELSSLRDESGAWVERDDVFIDYLGRRGPLGVGYGSDEEKIGPELGFGWVVGDASDEPVLIIKAAWGGKSMKTDFLPPSEGGPGPSYSAMMEHVAQTLEGMDERFPDLAGREHVIRGFVFFQGWNDYVDREQRESGYVDYTRRMRAMIQDVRERLKSPDLPIVVGQIGVGGPERAGAFHAAQEAIATSPTPLDGVRVVATAPHYDMVAHEMYEQDVWRGPDKQRFYNIASDRPYHYLGSGETLLEIGRAFGNEMLAMRAELEK